MTVHCSEHDREQDRILEDSREAIRRSYSQQTFSEKRLESDLRQHQNQREFESQEQHDIRVKKQSDRYHKSQGQRIEHLEHLRENVSAIRQSETNFYQIKRLVTSKQTTSALRDIESEENRRQRLNNDQIRRTNRQWQKRSLPHAHILIWLETKIKAEQIDDVIRAELQDPEVDPELFDVVKTHMVHCPCGSYNPRTHV
ncbi:ATP-dependent DNA helicase [Trichonephila inaurata madagascariensis]|uniref:ATP-dependent DNA helicase n=1 Tax=Trichonephila inaurata madagascariensis TaxID=2747483 RepID=A0A8X6WLP5_9ARAC|nr:ATP-dependent DNA helicase [Trichonephila inaurata madagascariensis]